METNLVEEVANLVAENRSLKDKVCFLESRCIMAERFYDVPLTTEVVASLHQVCTSVVRKYIKLGLIEQHPMSSDSKMYVRASDALTLNFTELKRKAKFLSL